MKRSSVLSRLSFRWLAVIHLLMSARHSEMRVAIWVSEEGKESDSWVPRDLLHKENRRGPSTAPWGTPVSRVQGLERRKENLVVKKDEHR